MVEEWYKVENLERLQKEAVKKYEDGERDNRSDFHSYRMLKEGKRGSNIESHNVTGIYSDIVAKFIMIVLNNYAVRHSISLKKNILGDLGGG